jgi:molecular chaperone DnaK
MKKEAEEHAGEDKARRELVDLKNQAEHIIYATKKSLEEHGEKVSAEARGNIEAAITNLEDKLKGDDKPALEAALKQLNDSSIELGKAVYEAAAAQAPPPEAGTGPAGAEATGGSSGGDDDVIDAEYEVKDDK